MYFIRKHAAMALLFSLTACATQVPLQAETAVSNTKMAAMADADSWTYLSPAQIDSTRFLGPPPDAAATRREIEFMLSLQAQRTPAQVKLAVADHEQSVFRFASIIGDGFRPDRLPLTASLFETLHETGNVMEKQGKNKWKRVRPPLADARIQPVAKYSRSGSYPSGHATFSFLSAIVLADLLPEKSEQIFARAREFGENRVIGGVHYPSDVAAGQRLATLIAVLIQQNPAFQQDFAAARAELRAAMHLP
ncbi:phosphatase PAP2 family protein [Herminiimonas glaciei]|uniref:Acid phosphatase n=1 Tax=Herminiimonas glaciei TaxID=523788 RepID=A0ABW2ID65_9BURK